MGGSAPLNFQRLSLLELLSGFVKGSLNVTAEKRKLKGDGYKEESRLWGIAFVFYLSP